MHLSFAELMRASSDALRGLGAPFGQADDAIECLVLTQCALGTGYALLHEADSRRSASWSAPVLEHRSDRETGIDLRGQSLLMAAARVADYGATRERGTVLRVENTFGHHALPYLAHRAAVQGTAIAAAWRGVEGSAGAIAVAIPRANGPVVHWASDVAAWAQVAGSMGGSTATSLPPALHNGELCIVVGAPGVDTDVGAFAADGATATLDFLEARRAALVQGLVVEEADHRFFQSLTKRIRIPTSERSRAQAG